MKDESLFFVCSCFVCPPYDSSLFLCYYLELYFESVAFEDFTFRECLLTRLMARMSIKPISHWLGYMTRHEKVKVYFWKWSLENMASAGCSH